MRSLPTACGKYVQNLWKQHRKTCQHLSTAMCGYADSTITMWVKPVVFRTIIPVFIPQYSTTKIRYFPLLGASYTHNPHPLLLTLRREN